MAFQLVISLLIWRSIEQLEGIEERTEEMNESRTKRRRTAQSEGKLDGRNGTERIGGGGDK